MTAAAVPDTKREVLLIDLSALFWTAWHSSGNDAVSDARQRTLASVQRCVGDGNRLVAICCDSGRSFRKDLSPDYKAQRPEKDHASLGELDRVKERLRADGFLLWEAPGFEADDIIATAVNAAWGIGHDVLIASADKDLLQLVGANVRCLRTHTWTFVGETEVTDTLGVRPAQIADWLALCGDKSDGIKGASGTKGAPGIGAKTAADLLSKFGTLAGVYEAASDAGVPGMTDGVRRQLITARASVDLARKLVTLRGDVPIRFEDIYEEKKPMTIAPSNDTPPPASEQDDASDADFEDAPPPSKPVEVKPAQRAPAAPPTTAIALAPVPFDVALEPRSLAGAVWLAKVLYESRLYSRFPSPEAITAVIIRGREMGLGALTALDCFHVIEGKPAAHAHLIIARSKSHPDCEYFQCVETTPTSATWETKNRRNPTPTRLTYTLEQARAAGLIKQGSNWEKRAPEMIRKTCGVQLGRLEYPDAAMGLYATEELGGGEAA